MQASPIIKNKTDMRSSLVLQSMLTGQFKTTKVENDKDEKPEEERAILKVHVEHKCDQEVPTPELRTPKDAHEIGAFPVEEMRKI